MQIIFGILIGIFFNFLFVGVFYLGYRFGKQSKVTPKEKVEVSHEEKLKREILNKDFEQMMAYSTESAIKKVGLGNG